MRFLSIQYTSFKKILFGMSILVFHFMIYRFVLQSPIDKVNLDILNNKYIAIDAGHGGRDDGAVWHGLKEKDINLLIAQKLAKILKDHKAVVFMTRDSDLDYYTNDQGSKSKRRDLLTRVELIEKSKAEIFVSIHLNASRDQRWSGAQVFYSPKFETNKRLAEIMQSALSEFPHGNKRQVKEDRDIIVINAVSIPGVLIEAGFISNKHEASMLAQQEYQQKLAMQIAKGIAYYLSNNEVR